MANTLKRNSDGFLDLCSALDQEQPRTSGSCAQREAERRLKEPQEGGARPQKILQQNRHLAQVQFVPNKIKSRRKEKRIENKQGKSVKDRKK